MHTVDPVSNKEATKGIIKILVITYEKYDLDKVASSATQLNQEEIKLLLGLLNKFE